MPSALSARRRTSSSYVVAAVVVVQILARHRSEIGKPANRRVAIRVRAKRRGRDLLIEELIGIVLAPLQLRNDHGAFRLAVVRLVEAVRHALGFDEQQLVERVASRSLKVGGLVNPGVAVPHSAETLYQTFHLVTRDVLGALEVHVLDPV